MWPFLSTLWFDWQHAQKMKRNFTPENYGGRGQVGVMVTAMGRFGGGCTPMARAETLTHNYLWHAMSYPKIVEN